MDNQLDYEINKELGECYLFMGDFDKAEEYYRKAASQGLRYAEIFFDPQAHTCRGVSFHTVISGLRRAQLEAEQTLGVI